ncbi:MAG: 7-cyano-7-deazaguanine synthase [Acidobacteriota bacterium]|jgi:7-cyano-7-deazaguanine synthase|nr:MAG: 7-cyano-7-deazaguanine synthase [Acidobacteriota bacterium]
MATEPSAVLLSGGLDSVVLMARELADGRTVWPVHVRVGLAWEDAEAAALARIVTRPELAGRLQPLTTLHFDMRDLYTGAHWAVAGRARGWTEPDESVYLEGRNITLLSKAAIFCASVGIPRLVLGPLAGNPFPDATPAFFDAMARALSLGLDHRLSIEAPFRSMHKADVIRLGVELGVPLALTMSCNAPIGMRHCGRCNKCRERHEAFLDANVPDETDYVDLVVDDPPASGLTTP